MTIKEEIAEVIAMRIYEHNNLGPAPITEKEKIVYQKEAQSILEALLNLKWECEKCKGSGKIAPIVGYPLCDCPACEGNGKVKCPVCGGIMKV